MAVAVISQRLFRVLIWFAAVVLPATPGWAITIAGGDPGTTDVVDTNSSDPNYLMADGVSMSGVVVIYIAGFGGCTGALLGDGTSILTAGHCVLPTNGVPVPPSAITIYFQGPGGLNVSNPYTATSIAVDPGFNGNNNTSGQDLAVIQLNALAPASATEYQLDMEPAALGTNTVLDGYGIGGTGVSGDCPTQTVDSNNQPIPPCPVAYPFGTLRAGENDFGVLGNQDGLGWSSNLLVGQFYDSGDSATNALNCLSSNIFGCTSNPYSPSDEVDLSFGDSGGPAFQMVDGVPEIVGVNDLIGCEGTATICNTPPSEYSTTIDSSFGQLYAATSVLGYRDENLNFIEAQIAPEPSTLSLMLGALLASLLLRMRWLRMRRMESTPAEISPRQRRALRWPDRG